MKVCKTHTILTTFTLVILILLQSCTRRPFDPQGSATLNRDKFSFIRVLPATAIRALSVAGSSTSVLCISAMKLDGEIVLLTDEQGYWAELGRITAFSSSAVPILDIAPGTDGFWFVLVSDDTNGVVLHHTNGTVHTEQTIPQFNDGDWSDVCGQLETTGGYPSTVLLSHTGSVVLCERTSDMWTLHDMPDLTVSAELLHYKIDPTGRHHVLYRDSFTTESMYRSFSLNTWTRAEPVENGPEQSHAGMPLQLSLSESNSVRVIGFDYSRNVLVMWEDVGLRFRWEAEGLPIAEDTLMDRYLSVVTAPDGTPHVMVARYHGAVRYELLWLSRRSYQWEVHTIASGLYRWSQFNPIRLAAMAIAGDVPHLVFAELGPGGEEAVLWDAVLR